MLRRFLGCAAAGSATVLVLATPAVARVTPTAEVTSAETGVGCTIDVDASVSGVHGPNYVVQFYGYQGLYVQAYTGTYPVANTTADPETVPGTITVPTGHTVESVKALLQKKSRGGGLTIVAWSSSYTLSQSVACGL